ncbi:MAG TPA: aminoglycoside adenylyltransferase domain-containing protein [Acidimicrobiales bacterium]|nr:aminoglycoside adenylyltransferase domain-containing protein [Acidimicrobiales bacterium]
MIPSAVERPLATFVSTVERVAGGRLAAVYLVGGVALGDFSPRQSNIDLVVVCDPPLGAEEVSSLRRAERQLQRAGRPAAVWYSGWDEIADGPSGDPAARSPLETPMTRAMLREEAVAYVGPDWPVVAYDEAAFREWCRRSLEELVAGRHGLLIWRRDVSPLVLQAARLAQGAATGRVLSKTEAGEGSITLLPAHFRRILHDAAGYRNGANFSMYYGPFERKYDTRLLFRQLVEAVRAEPRI